VAEDSDWACLATTSQAMLKHYLNLLPEQEQKIKTGKGKVSLRIACCGSLFLEMATVVTGINQVLEPEQLAASWKSFQAFHTRCALAASTQTDAAVRNRLFAVLDAGRLTFLKLAEEKFADCMDKLEKLCTDVRSTTTNEICVNFENMAKETTCLDDKAKVTAMLKACESSEAAKLLEALFNVDALAQTSKSVRQPYRSIALIGCLGQCSEQLLSSALRNPVRSLSCRLCLGFVGCVLGCSLGHHLRCQEMQEAVEGNTREHASFCSSLAAMEKRMVSIQQPLMRETADAGKIMGNMCIVQALKRPLTAGETRDQLIRKCLKLFKKRPYLSAWPHLQSLVAKPTPAAG